VSHEREQTQKRQQASGQRKHKEFDRRIAPLLASPHADQEKERNQRELEEDVEQD
jgi:hypothetical protein